MVISPQQASEFTKEEKKLIRELEGRIDRELREKYSTTTKKAEVRLPYEPLLKTRLVVFEHLMNLYREQCWEVKLEDRNYSEGYDRIFVFKAKN